MWHFSARSPECRKKFLLFSSHFNSRLKIVILCTTEPNDVFNHICKVSMLDNVKQSYSGNSLRRAFPHSQLRVYINLDETVSEIGEHRVLNVL